MKNLIVMCFTALCAFGANAQTKIAAVSADEIFSLMPEARQADSALNAYQIALNQSLVEQEKELNEALEKFVKDSATMSTALREVKKKTLQDRVAEFQNKDQQSRQELEAKRGELFKPVQDKLMAVIKKVAKQLGYTHVLLKEQMIMFPESDDITEAVKKDMNIKNPAPRAAGMPGVPRG
jgi:outer membrane protein